MHAALTQVLGGLWAFILSMIACLTGRCAHSPFKSELPVVALYEDQITRKKAPKAAAGVSVSAYGATSVEARTNGGFGALFNDSGEELDNKEVGTAIGDIEVMKSEWSKLLKQGSESSSSDEDGAYFTFTSLEYNVDYDLARRSLLSLIIYNKETFPGARSIPRHRPFFTRSRTRPGRRRPSRRLFPASIHWDVSHQFSAAYLVVIRGLREVPNVPIPPWTGIAKLSITNVLPRPLVRGIRKQGNCVRERVLTNYADDDQHRQARGCSA